MDFDKLKQWMEFAQKYQKGEFWNQIFEKGYNGQFTSKMDDAGDEKAVPKTFPSIDIFQTETTNIILIDLPGLTKDDIHLAVSGDILKITGVCKKIDGIVTTITCEKYYGEFERTIVLPESTNGTDIQAKFQNGLLMITYPKIKQKEEKIIID